MNIVLEVNETMIVDIQTKNIMLKACVITVITNMEELRSLGFVVMINFMHVNILFYSLEGLC